MSKLRKLTLQEVLNFLDDINSAEETNINKVEALYIEPPENDGNISGDSDVDENEVSVIPGDLCAGQLRAGCEIVLSNGDSIDCFVDDNENIEEFDLEVTATSTSSRRQKHVDVQIPSTELEDFYMTYPIPKIDLNNDFTWLPDNSQPLLTVFPDPTYEDCIKLKPHQQFEKFFSTDVLKQICKCTNMYAVHNHMNIDPVKIDELRVVIGILLVGGYIGQNSFHNLWSSGMDLRNEMVYNSMRLDRFENIISSLHFEENLHPVLTNKMWKICPLIDVIKANMMRNFHPEQHLSYGECMIPYFGKQGCKQLIQGKEIRLGYKVWTLCTSSGYLISFEVCQGKNVKSNIYQKHFGECAATLVSMIDDLPEELQSMPYSFFCDKLCTGVPLLTYLQSRGYNATGIIQENRIPEKCPIPKNGILKSKPRGHIASIQMQETGIHLTKWIDNSVVCIASTEFGKLPIISTHRYSRQSRKKIPVTRPYNVSEYNEYMCGVDRFDQNMDAYRIEYRGQKWWFPIFTWLIDACVQNSWQLHRRVNPTMSLFQFKREIAMFYCNHYGKNPNTRESTTNHKRKSAATLENSLQYDRLDHLVVPIDKKRRCAGKRCISIIRTKCAKCDVGLCLKCFKSFHTVVS